MQGVEILTQAQVATSSAFNWTAFWTIASVLSVAGLFLSVLMTFGNDLEWMAVPVVWLFATLFGCFIGFIVGKYDCSTQAAYETQYKVTISDEVPMTEFLERYEIIEQDGKIFTVIEKTNVKED